MVFGKSSLKPGFSVTELAFYVLIVGILATGAIVAFSSVMDKARKSSTETTLRTMQQGIDMYQGEVGRYPESLEDLVVRPEGLQGWDGPYVKVKGDQLPKDGWKRDFQYERTPGAVHPYELYSFGKNGEDAPQEEWLSAW